MKKVINEMLSKRAGVDVSTPAGSEWLRNDIESATDERLSVNTVKRITGVLGDGNYIDEHARRSTLDVLARYLGFTDWPDLKSGLCERSSFFQRPPGTVEMATLPVDAIVTLRWDPDRCVRLRHFGEELYVVESSENSKLMKDDILIISDVRKGHYLIVRDVIRGGESLGCYTAAMVRGLTSIEISEHE